MSVHHGYWTSRLSNYAIQGLNARPLNPRIFSSAALCVSAARASIHLIKYIPQGDFACVWLILYFPVSALVTLFGNILQNPQDPRARSDVRLMNLVVSFLAALVVEEENGGVKRMLGVCSEFERIAKVVLDKSEKEHHSRRKRKTHDEPLPKTSLPKTAMQTPQMMNGNVPSVVFNGMDGQNGQHGNTGFDHTGFSPISGASTLSWLNNNDASSSSSYPETLQQQHYLTPTSDLLSSYNDLSSSSQQQTFSTPSMSNGSIGGGTTVPEMNSPLNMNNFQQPFVPQDLWQMPMTFEWDWQNMTGGEYPSYENGVVGDQTLTTGMQGGRMPQM